MITFIPIYQPKPWGGRALQSSLNRDLPEGLIGESWEIVDAGPLQSVVESGPHAGKTLRSLIREDPQALMGANWDPERPFPLLIKWLDCEAPMSLQVHPPESLARELGGHPKTEAWIIAGCKPEAFAYFGFKRPISQQAFLHLIEQGSPETALQKLSLKTGDAAFVPSGRIHALCGRYVILEVQQNSDTTYRIYDWGRIGADGKPRQLHIPEALRCIDFEDVLPSLAKPKREVIIECPHFRLRKWTLQAGQVLEVPPQGAPWIISILEGSLQGPDKKMLPHGKNCLIFAHESIEWKIEVPAQLIITDAFA